MAQFCPQCGSCVLDAEREAYLFQLAEIEAAAQVANQQAMTYRCVVCGASLSAADLYCAGCGTPADKARGGCDQASESELSTDDGVPPTERVCPSCGALVDADNKFCMSCGASLTS